MIEYFLARGLVTVERSRRKGVITRAQFLSSVDRARCSRSRGGRPSTYSFPRHRGDKRDWRHKDLPSRAQIEPLFGSVDGEPIDAFQHAIFAAVPLSVMRLPAPSPAAPANESRRIAR